MTPAPPRPVILASVIGDGTISVSLTRLDESADAKRAAELLATLLPTIGMVQDLGGAGDEIHVLTHSPAATITQLIRLAGEHGIEVRDVTQSRAPVHLRMHDGLRACGRNTDGAIDLPDEVTCPECRVALLVGQTPRPVDLADPVAPDESPTTPYLRETVIVDDPDAPRAMAPGAQLEIVIREDDRVWSAEEVAVLGIRDDALNLPHEIQRRLTARGYRVAPIAALDYRFEVVVVRPDRGSP